MTDSLRPWQTSGGQDTGRAHGVEDLPFGPPSSQLQPKHRWRRWHTGGSALVAVVIVGGIGVTNAILGDRTGATVPPVAPGAAVTPQQAKLESGSGAEPELIGTEWQLAEYVINGHTTIVPDEVDSVLRFDKWGRFSAHACQYSGGMAVLHGRQLELDRSPAMTANACGGVDGEVGSVVWGFIGPGWLEWSINLRRLVLRNADGDALVYRVRDSIYPDRSARTIVAGERDGNQYRVAVGDSDSGELSVVILDVRPGPGTAWSGGDMLATPIGAGAGVETLLFHKVGDEHIVTGIAPAGVVRIVHHDRVSGADTELARYPVGGREWNIFVGFVPSHTNGSTISAYDAAGNLVVTWSRNR
jgi:hypothetical protein